MMEEMEAVCGTDKKIRVNTNLCEMIEIMIASAEHCAFYSSLSLQPHQMPCNRGRLCLNYDTLLHLCENYFRYRIVTKACSPGIQIGE